MPYLLDTNAWIHYLKNPASPIRTNLASLRPADVVTCSIVRSELLHGAEKYGNRNRRINKVNQTLAPFNSLPFDDADAAEYARIRHELELAGQVIGPYDLQIAAICVRHGFTLVTRGYALSPLRGLPQTTGFHIQRACSSSARVPSSREMNRPETIVTSHEPKTTRWVENLASRSSSL